MKAQVLPGTIEYSSVLPIASPLTQPDMVIAIITVSKVCPKWERGWVDVQWCVPVASGVIGGKFPQSVPVLALTVLLVARSIITEDVKRCVICLAHNILAHHVYAVTSMRRVVCESLTMYGLPESLVNDTLQRCLVTS